MTKYLSCADTAKLIRKALKEAFPGVKFSVRSHTYSMGASINVGWTDGPADCQVKAVVSAFQGGWFDGMTDYKGGCVHSYNGESVHFGTDFIFTNRKYSESMVKRGLEQVAKESNGEFNPAEITLDTEYDGGWYVKDQRVLTQGWHQGEWITSAVRNVLSKRSQIATQASPTAKASSLERTY